MPGGTDPVLGGLLLAAGGSERLGQPKQLVLLGGESLLHRTVNLLLTQISDLVVVTGAFAPEVRQQLQNLAVRVEQNNRWQAGMGGSIAAGMEAVSDDRDGVLIMLCDQWRIGHEDLQALIRTWKKEPQTIATANWGENNGPPVIFPRRFFDKLRRLRGEQGAKSLLSLQSGICHVEIPNAQFDLDTDEDLQCLRDWDSQHGSADSR
jgi:molybdenum cofactor cytidylyltransferase